MFRDYLDIEIRIEAGANDGYPVSVRGPGGDARGTLKVLLTGADTPPQVRSSGSCARFSGRSKGLASRLRSRSSRISHAHSCSGACVRAFTSGILLGTAALARMVQPGRYFNFLIVSRFCALRGQKPGALWANDIIESTMLPSILSLSKGRL